MRMLVLPRCCTRSGTQHSRFSEGYYPAKTDCWPSGCSRSAGVLEEWPVGDDNTRKTARASRNRILRYIGLFTGLIVGGLIGSSLAGSLATRPWWAVTVVLSATVGGLLFVIAPYIIVGGFRWLRQSFADVPAIDIVAAGIGLIAGGILASLLAFPTSLLPNPAGQILPFVVAVVACFLSVFIVVLRKEDLAELVFRRNGVSTVEDKLLLDTSAIIDGRIVDLMRTNIVTMPLAVPRFILRELQGIADSSDSSKKIRGRRGLDALDQLQREESISVEMLEVEVDEEQTVDNKLIRLAELSRYLILTGDQNLERIARLQGVTAININSIATAVRPPVIAGEELEMKIVQEGREAGQGIGFLEDGTLIVVENGDELVGSDVRVVVTRILQTGTGRMAFATIKNEVVA